MSLPESETDPEEFYDFMGDQLVNDGGITFIGGRRESLAHQLKNKPKQDSQKFKEAKKQHQKASPIYLKEEATDAY